MFECDLGNGRKLRKTVFSRKKFLNMHTYILGHPNNFQKVDIDANNELIHIGT